MILYHGSFIEISSPDLRHSRVNVDFGRGFYATPILSRQKSGVLNSKDGVKKALFQCTNTLRMQL